MYADFKLKHLINNEIYIITGRPIANLARLSVSVDGVSFHFAASGTSLIGAGTATSAALIYYVI